MNSTRWLIPRPDSAFFAFQTSLPGTFTVRVDRVDFTPHEVSEGCTQGIIKSQLGSVEAELGFLRQKKK